MPWKKKKQLMVEMYLELSVQPQKICYIIKHLLVEVIHLICAHLGPNIHIHLKAEDI